MVYVSILYNSFVDAAFYDSGRMIDYLGKESDDGKDHG
jgi:hypothetical protein